MSSGTSSSSLRVLLSQVDGSAMGIHSAAGAMMKHYDKSQVDVAIVEWRNSLHNAPIDRHLPLLYVANEVLQNSKRNRGNKFLEAFSPILGQSLIFICQHQGKIGTNSGVEKVRRTVKIWGDRRVFSLRFVNELLKGLEPYRYDSKNKGANKSTSAYSNANGDTTTVESHGNNNNGYNSLPAPSSHHLTSSVPSGNTFSPDPESPLAKQRRQEDQDEDDLMNIHDGDKSLSSDNDRSDDDDGNNEYNSLFRPLTESKLKVSILTIDEIAVANSNHASNFHGEGKATKRRRKSGSMARSDGSTGGLNNTSSNSSGRNRSKVLSTTSLIDIWKQVSELTVNYNLSQSVIKETRLWLDDMQHNTTILESLVGDDLLDTYKIVSSYQEKLNVEKGKLHSIANERQKLQNDAKKYLAYFENAIKQDEDDVKFCSSLLTQIQLFQHVHSDIRYARDQKIKEEILHQKNLEALAQKKRDEEESKRFRESALRSETEEKPGMVWNPNTREYQYLDTDESWRD